MSHTPGPWHWLFFKRRNGELTEHPHALSNGSTDVLLATESREGGIWAEVSLADRALIEAAPELLAVCEELVAYQKHFEVAAWEPGCMPGNQLYSDMAMAIVRKARAAIAAARGKA